MVFLILFTYVENTALFQVQDFFTLFPIEKLRCALNLRIFFTSLQAVHRLAWKEPNIYTSGAIKPHPAPPPPPTIDCGSTPNFQFSHCMTLLLYPVFY
jgi:hypothetical protein